MNSRDYAARIGLFFGGISGAVAVAGAAWAAHGLADNPTAQAWADTASRVQLIHATALMMLGLFGTVKTLPPAATRSLMLAGGLFILGTLFFCGTLYTLAIRGMAPFPGSAPLGGTALIAGWLAVAATGLTPALRQDSRKET